MVARTGTGRKRAALVERILLTFFGVWWEELLDGDT